MIAKGDMTLRDLATITINFSLIYKGGKLKFRNSSFRK